MNFKNLSVITTFVLSMLVVSCEKEENDQISSSDSSLTQTTNSIIPEGIVETNHLFKTGVLNSASNGKIIKNVLAKGISTYDVNAGNINLETNTGFLYIDADNADGFDEIVELAENNNISIIIESGSGDEFKLSEMLNEFGIEGSAEALFIINKGEFNSIVPAGKNHSLSVDEAFETFYEIEKEYNNSQVSQNEINTTESKENSTTDEFSNRSGKTYTFRWNNYSYSRALKESKDWYGGGKHCSFKNIKNETKGLSAKEIKKSKIHDDWIKKGSTHRAKGKCRGQQTASYSQSLSYSKTWGVSVGGGVDVTSGIIKLTYKVTSSYSTGKTEGISNGTSLKMHKEWAQGGVVVPVRKHEGTIDVEQTLEWKVSCKGEGKSDVIRAILTNKGNNFTTWLPAGKEYFQWATWGPLLKKC